MIENSLRETLAARAGTVIDNPGRVGDVHARISGIRRRRTAGAALVLVLLALVGALLTRLPGRPETLPAGVPAGPYFGDEGIAAQRPTLPGYRSNQTFPIARGDRPHMAAVVDTRTGPNVMVARCAQPGSLTVRTEHGESTLRCRVPVGHHYEGALLTTPQLLTNGVLEADLLAGTDSDWVVSLQAPLFPDRLTPTEVRRSLLNGLKTPTGGRIVLTVSSDISLSHVVPGAAACVRDVHLELTIAGRPAGDVLCDDASADAYGIVSFGIGDPVVQSLRPGERVTLEVRQVGGPPGQWAILSVN